MSSRLVALACWLLLSGSVAAQAPLFPREPILQLQPDGPVAAIQGVAFGRLPGSDTALYAGGFDKVVHRWQLRGKDASTSREPFRVPIGPGSDGLLNAVAASPDGRLVAAAGVALIREAPGFRQSGVLRPRLSMSRDMLEDQGTVCLFDATRGGAVRALRGHRGQVLSMIFAPAAGGKPALLVSCAREQEKEASFGVVRVWNADTGKELAAVTFRPDPEDERPDLAVWHTGDGERDLAVVMATNRHPLQVWDVPTATGFVPLKPANRTPNRNAVFLPEGRSGSRGSLWTVSADLRSVQRWAVNGTAGPAKDAAEVVVEPNGGIVALAALPLADGPAGLAAVVMYPKAGKFANQFRLVVLRPGATGMEVARAEGVPLWALHPSLPTLAASPDGRALAVASSPRQEILVFPSDELARGNTPTPRRLASRGMILDEIAFVQAGGARGLRLRGRGAATAWVLGFDGKVVPNEAAWAADALDAQWHVNERKNRDGQVTAHVVSGPDFKGEVPLQPTQQSRLAAVLPPAAGRRPLLVLAWEEFGLPYLGLFDPRTGRQVRQFSGFSDRVLAIAIDKDARLLAAACEDKLLCVWSLTDLPAHLGKRGMIDGLAVGAGLRILELNPKALSAANRKAAEGLKVGDVIEQFATPHDFYEAVWLANPSNPMTVRVRGKGAVTFALDQGIDDQRPLFSLFLDPSAAGRPEWLAWSPQGPYDASALAALESRIAWQQNPPRHGAAVEVSGADKYRGEYHREGLLPLLVKNANLDAALKELRRQSVEPPDLSLDLDGLADPPKQDARGRAVLDAPPKTLRAVVAGVPLWRVESVQWAFDGGAARPFTQHTDREQVADVSGLAWTRGPHEVRLVVRTSDGAEHSLTRRLSYPRRPPTVAFDAGWLKKEFGDPLPKRLETMKPKLVVLGNAAPAETDADVTWSLRHNDRVIPLKGRALREEVTLAEGANVFELRGENAGAEPDAANERAASRLVVQYTPKPPSVPSIQLEAVRPRGGDEVSLLPRPPKVVAVEAPVVRVRGRVRAEDPLSEVRLDKVKLSSFDAAKLLKTFEIDEEVKLSPGQRELVFTARVEKGVEREQRLTLAYLPALPKLDPSEPRAVRREVGQPLEFDLKLAVIVPTPRTAFTARVRVNDRTGDIVATVAANGVLTAKVKLDPGPNTVRVRFSNEYRPEPVEEALSYFVPRPPTIQSFVAKTDGKKPVADLEARVRSVDGVPVTAARLRKDGREVAARPTIEAVAGQWVVRYRVDLTEGTNEFDLRARNAEGESAASTLTVTYKAPVAPPRIERLVPHYDAVVDQPTCPLEFRVVSPADVPVQVRLNGKLVALPKAEKLATGLVYRLTLTALEAKRNEVEIEVPGAPTERLAVTYVPMWTAALTFDRVQERDAADKVHRVNEKLPVGNVVIHGWVDFRKPDDPLLKEPAAVQCWVNDFKQQEMKLEEAIGTRRRFSLPARLNRRQNRVLVQLPEAVKLAGTNTNVVELDCGNPVDALRLHLLFLVQDKDGLVQRVLDAFQASEVKDDRFTTPVFAPAILYGRSDLEVTPERIKGRLKRIETSLQLARSAENDVLVVFFQGEEETRGKKTYLHTDTSRASGDVRDAIDFDALRQRLSLFRGAKLLLLDTRQRAKAGDAPAANGDGAILRLGTYRYVWLGDASAREKARLVDALKDTLANEPRVREHRSFLQKWAGQFGKDALFTLDSPPDLELLELTRPRRKSP